MPARTGCCRNNKYTTRKYDLSGNALWSFDYFNGVSISGKFIESQAVDSTHVYVAGDWTDDGTNQWSIAACGLTTGTLVWRADLKTYMAGFSYDVGDVQQVLVDPNNGRVVCLLKSNSAGTSQAVVVISTAGAILSNAIFALPLIGFGVYTTPMSSFVINEDGDYHLVNGTRQIFEFFSPFSSAPTVRHLGDNLSVFGFYYLTQETPLITGASITVPNIAIIKRFSGRDYYGMQTGSVSSGNATGMLIVLKGKSQHAVPWQSADFDLTITQSPSYGPSAYKVTDLCIDPNNGDFVLMGGATSRGTMERYGSTGAFKWIRDCGGWSVTCDSSGYSYAAGKKQIYTSDPDPSISSIQEDGTYRWGHDNADSDTRQGHCIDYESSGPSVIKTGQSFSGGNGPFSSANDVNFITDQCSATPGCTGDCNYIAGNHSSTITDHDSGTGSYTTTQNCEILIYSWGGAGGGGDDTFLGGVQGYQGGGSGGLVVTGPYPAGAGETFNWAVGAGGIGGIGFGGTSDGANGGDTTITGFFTATAGGGKGGLGRGGSNTGAGGIASGDTFSTNGNAGSTNSGTTGGAGGNAPGVFGGLGGAGGSSGNNGSAGVIPGGGGGGGGRNAANGGAGANGRVRIVITTWDWVYDSDDCSGCSACETNSATLAAKFGHPSSATDTLDVVCS